MQGQTPTGVTEGVQFLLSTHKLHVLKEPALPHHTEAILQDTQLGIKAFSIAFQANDLSEETSQRAVKPSLTPHSPVCTNLHSIHSDICSDLGVELSQQPLANERPTEMLFSVTQELRKQTALEKWTIIVLMSILSFLVMLSHLI